MATILVKHSAHSELLKEWEHHELSTLTSENVWELVVEPTRFGISQSTQMINSFTSIKWAENIDFSSFDGISSESLVVLFIFLQRLNVCVCVCASTRERASERERSRFSSNTQEICVYLRRIRRKRAINSTCTCLSPHNKQIIFKCVWINSTANRSATRKREEITIHI